jgi:CubicO group peptidase (beta-lactamase class C family)
MEILESGETIAGEIVTTVSGEPYAEYISKHILEPLGMTGTTRRRV